MEEITQEGMDKITEMFQQIMRGFESIMKKMDERNESIMEENRRFNQEWLKELRDDRLKGEELRNEKTEEIKNDSKPETGEIPNEKTLEQIVVSVSYTHLDVYKRQTLKWYEEKL